MVFRYRAIALAVAALAWPAAPQLAAQPGPARQIVQAEPQRGGRPGPRPGKKGPGAGRRPDLNDTVLRLMQLPPERRREVLRSNPRLRNMPPAQRRELLQRMERIDRMSPDDRELLLQRYQLFSRLRPEQQGEARALYRRWAALPRARRALMTRGVQRLRGLPAEERMAALESKGFQDRFSQQELEMLRDLVELTGPERRAVDEP